MVSIGCTPNASNPAQLLCDDASIVGLSDFGSDLGGFLSNLAPGVIAFVFILAIIGGLIGILGAIVYVIKKAVKTT